MTQYMKGLETAVSNSVFFTKVSECQWFFMPLPGQSSQRRRHYFLRLTVRPSFARPSVAVVIKLVKHDSLKTNAPISLQIGTSSLWGKGVKRSTFGVMWLKIKVTVPK